MTSIQNTIKIFTRIKPSPYKPVNYEISHRDCLETDEFLTFSLKGLTDEGYLNNKQEQYSYRFTEVFDRHCDQKQMFESVAQPVVDSALEGYNGTIFVYGQTGSGKTFTMTGSRDKYEDRGIIPRTLQYVFERFRNGNTENTIQAAFISYLEIYNEGGYDLLHSKEEFLPTRLEELAKVTLMEDGHQQMHLKNLTVHPVNSEEEGLHLLYLGDRNRTIAETPLNEASTRSHCIFTIHINLRSTSSSTVRRSKIHLVDLAGSERIANSNISGQLLCEARHINLALHYLEQVIVALGDSKRSHIPYRNSMMTSILRDSLGGNCMTSMIATLSVEPKNVQETLSTCRFSQRVALVTNAAVRNEELDPQLIINSLKQEVKRLKELLMSTSIKPITEGTEPLTEEEYTHLICLLDRFLSDKDSNAILAVEPDMRMIQASFQILKATIKDSNIRVSDTLQALPTPHSATYSDCQTANSQSSYEELSQIIKDRDSEIKVLVDMLRNERLMKSGQMDSNCNKYSDNVNFAEGDLESNPCTAVAPYKSISNSEEEEIILKEKNLSQSMRQALDAYMRNHKGLGSINKVRGTLREQREEVQNIQQNIDKNNSVLSSLEEILKTSTLDSGQTSDLQFSDLKKAILSQQRTLEMQQNRLNSTQNRMAESVKELTALYDKLLLDFDFDHKIKENEVGDEMHRGGALNEAMDVIKTHTTRNEKHRNANSWRSNTVKPDTEEMKTPILRKDGSGVDLFPFLDLKDESSATSTTGNSYASAYEPNTSDDCDDKTCKPAEISHSRQWTGDSAADDTITKFLTLRSRILKKKSNERLLH